MQGKKLTSQQIEAYKELYLITLNTHSGLHTIAEHWLATDNADIKINWDYYRKMWLADDLVFKTKFEAIKSQIMHKVEDTMYSKIFNERDTTLIKFVLERLDPKYQEKKQQTVDINQPVKINIIKPE